MYKSIFRICIGPGSYVKEFKWEEANSSLTRIKQLNDKHQHHDLIVKPYSKAPSIPTKKIPQNAYTGLGMDTVGPGCYDPNEDQVRQKVRKADFVSAKIPRKVFEPIKSRDNNLPSKENPGPGQYDSQIPNEKKDFNS